MFIDAKIQRSKEAEKQRGKDQEKMEYGKRSKEDGHWKKYGVRGLKTFGTVEYNETFRMLEFLNLTISKACKPLDCWKPFDKYNNQYLPIPRA